MALRRSIAIMVGAAALVAAVPALADVKAGVDAWSRGDWNAAVAQWQAPAEANDPDALFNLGQAYRLGRGVPQDTAKARDYYARAAKLGHLRAADTYGIMLFQAGERKAAMPYIENAARRGNPSAEYLMGIALFNGDLVPKDWVRAYALLTLANAQQLPQAKAALAQMDGYIPLDQRQQAAGLAGRLQAETDAARGRELAAADLAAGDEPATATSSAPLATATPRV
ncbi:MAG TPA: tetratricopeptide repeat protein, partial [Sphingomonadaceae bacterium]